MYFLFTSIVKLYLPSTSVLAICVLSDFKVNETPIKEILGAVDEIFKIQPIQKSEEKIIDKKPVKITKIENKSNDLEIKKNLNEKKDKKYDLMIINNAKDVLILNRIIFK